MFESERYNVPNDSKIQCIIEEQTQHSTSLTRTVHVLRGLWQMDSFSHNYLPLFCKHPAPKWFMKILSFCEHKGCLGLQRGSFSNLPLQLEVFFLNISNLWCIIFSCILNLALAMMIISSLYLWSSSSASYPFS
jgi:hypothetical protein